MRQNTRFLTLVLAGLSLATITGCGNDTPPAVTQPPEPVKPQPPPPPPPPPAPKPATGLAYTAPTATDGWRLLQDASSTPTRLVLNLVGPAGLKTRGVGFNLQAPAGVKFGAFDGGLPVHDLGVYQLRNNDENLAEPVALVGGVKPGNVLTVGVYQKDRSRDAKDSGVALYQIVLEFDAGAQLKVGDALPLSVLKAGAIPEDIGTVTDDMWTLNRKMKLLPVALQVGTLKAG
jgi:hypothetical protein